jgi:hypothetical protein
MSKSTDYLDAIHIINGRRPLTADLTSVEVSAHRQAIVDTVEDLLADGFTKNARLTTEPELEAQEFGAIILIPSLTTSHPAVRRRVVGGWAHTEANEFGNTTVESSALVITRLAADHYVTVVFDNRKAVAL